MGHDLHFLYIEAEAGGDVQSMRESWGEKFFFVPYLQPSVKSRLIKKMQKFTKRITSISIDNWYDPALDRVLKKLHKAYRFDAVLVEYVFFSKALKLFGPDVLKVVDTIDVFSNRHERMLQHGLQPNWYSAIPSEEARGLNRADVVIAISEEDRQRLSELVPRKEVMTVGHIVQVYQPPDPLPRSGKMLFVGSSNPMNAQAVQFFVNQVLPGVKQKHPGAQLLVAGSVCDLLEDTSTYVKLGKVENLQPIYSEVDVVLNPILFGTGLSIKSLEALGYSRPLVTTAVGARGLSEGAGKAFLVADTPEAFTIAVGNVLADAELSASLSRNAGELARQWNRQNLQALEDLFNA